MNREKKICTRREALKRMAMAAVLAGAAIPAVADDPKKPADRKKKKPGEKVVIPVEGPPKNPAKPPPGAVPELWFPVGEMFEYTIRWGIIPVGSSIVWSEWIEEDGRWWVAIRLRTRTNRVLSTLYPVDDYIESVIDPVAFVPRRFVKKVNEGPNRYDQLTTFDHRAGRAVWDSILDHRHREFDIKPDTRDLPALMWWLRKHTFKPGESREFEVMADEKMYTVVVEPDRYESLEAGGYGRIKTLKLEPKASFGGVFVRKGRMWMWVSEDPRRLGVRIQAEVPVATVKIDLERVTGPGDDFWVKPSE